jgi:hypothetical protein
VRVGVSFQPSKQSQSETVECLARVDPKITRSAFGTHGARVQARLLSCQYCLTEFCPVRKLAPMARQRSIGVGRRQINKLPEAARQLNEVLKPNPHTVASVAKATGKAKPTVYRWLDGEVPPDAVSAEWLKKTLGITGSWKK